MIVWHMALKTRRIIHLKSTILGYCYLRKACLQVWLLVDTYELNSEQFPTLIENFSLNDECLTVPELFVQTIWFMLNTCFFYGSQECDQPPIKTWHSV